MPDAILIGGANGAGKTTFARRLLRSSSPGVTFLNTDEVQAESPAFAHPVAAGRELLRRLAALEERGGSFALETTLASKMHARRIHLWKTSGYHVTLHYIQLPSDDFAVERVAKRVAAGGHDVPEMDIRRRFVRGTELFEVLYKPLVDECYHWYSDDKGLSLVEYWER